MKTLAIDSLDDLPDAAEAVIDALAGRTVVAFRGEDVYKRQTWALFSDNI